MATKTSKPAKLTASSKPRGKSELYRLLAEHTGLQRKQVALLTRAEYFHAATAQDLLKVYESLSNKLVVERKETEITALLALLGALLVTLAGGLGVYWFGRVA